MSKSVPPEIISFAGEWSSYEDRIYAEFIQSFVEPKLQFQGLPVTAQHRPATREKGYSFWHVISEAPDSKNKNEDDRIPNLRRCERINWIAWLIQNAGKVGFLWWENKRGTESRVVIWAENHDFAIVLAKRNGYYVLKTAYAELSTHRKKSFQSEYDKFWNP